MRRIILPATAAVIIASGCTTVPASRAPELRAELALRVSRLLDPVSGQYDSSVVILVWGGRIADVIPAARFKTANADTVIDLRGFTVLPGLIDGHVHLAIGGPVRANALADLRAGFTTVVDLGARTNRLLQIRDSINAGYIPGPRVLAAGIWVGTKGGVCEFNGIGIAGGPEEFRARIRENAAAGAEITKLCVSGWPADAFANPMKYEMSDEVLRASVDEARRLGRIVVAHDISLGGVRAGVAAGINGLAHSAYLDSAAARQMRDKGVFMISTLASLTAGDTSRAATALVESARLAHHAGVRLVFGTDGGVLPHGRNAEELTALVSAGLTPLEAIRTATINAASAFGIADSVGALRRGMVADLIAVQGDPKSDVTVFARPQLVMSRGRVIQ